MAYQILRRNYIKNTDDKVIGWEAEALQTSYYSYMEAQDFMFANFKNSDFISYSVVPNHVANDLDGVTRLY